MRARGFCNRCCAKNKAGLSEGRRRCIPRSARRPSHDCSKPPQASSESRQASENCRDRILTCHPERSIAIRFSNRYAESKDPCNRRRNSYSDREFSSRSLRPPRRTHKLHRSFVGSPAPCAGLRFLRMTTGKLWQEAEYCYAVRGAYIHFSVHYCRGHIFVAVAEMVAGAGGLVAVVELVQSRRIVGVQHGWVGIFDCPDNSVACAIRRDAGGRAGICEAVGGVRRGAGRELRVGDGEGLDRSAY